jgi:hypothetical protein
MTKILSAIVAINVCVFIAIDIATRDFLIATIRLLAHSWGQ